MSGNFTGPVVVVPFIGNAGTEFALTFHVGVDDEESISRITKRLAEDGYKPDLKRTRRYMMVNGSLEPREEPQHRSGPIGFRMRSAHLRS